MQKILEGSLTRFEVPDVLTFLNMGRRTGVLVMERPLQETKFFFRDGNPVFANTTKTALRLGSMLVRLGKVPQDRMDRVLARQRAAGHRIGQILLSERILKEEELASFLKVQVSEVIFDTFEWRDGTFMFFDSVPPPITAVTLQMQLQNLIMEGVRRIDERGRLSEVFPDLEAVPEVLANPERVKHSVTLTQEEWQVFFLIDGRRSLSEVCRLAGNPDELATLQVLHNLLTAKFLVVHPPTGTARDDVLSEAPALVDEGTALVVEGRKPYPAPFSVEFNPASSGVKKRIDDDTHEVVTPKAVQYAGAPTQSRLVLVKDGNETSFPLTRDSTTLGRHRNNDVVVSDPKVSSFHARIDKTQEGFVIVDLKSRNGTFVNGKRAESALLKTGDEVRLGTARLVYKVDYTAST
jgi:hypothetical protein